MNRSILAVIILALSFIQSGYAAPILSVVPGGIQGGNWVWDVSVTPDLALAGGSTPLAVELGFRLTSAPLLNVTNVNPAQFDTNNPGKVIFGWETPYGAVNPLPEGLEINCTGCTANNLATFGGHAETVVLGTANEIFAAFGSIEFNSPGPEPFLKIIAQGPGNGGPPSSTIQWLGAYAVGQGRIAQLAGSFNSMNFDDYSGTSTQSVVPEPASLAMLALGASAAVLIVSMRQRRIAPKF
jgi:PEP-CTERM motif